MIQFGEKEEVRQAEGKKGRMVRIGGHTVGHTTQGWQRGDHIVGLISVSAPR